MYSEILFSIFVCKSRLVEKPLLTISVGYLAKTIEATSWSSDPINI